MIDSRLTHQRFLLIALFGFLANGAIAMGEEEEQICRFCTGYRATAALGLDLEGDGFRYAPDRHVDILHIKLDVTPDFKRRTVSGTTTISFAPIAQPLAQLRLDAIDLAIKDVRSRAKIADFVSTKKDLTIQFDPPIPAGVKVDVEIDHEAEPKRGLYFRTPEMGYPASDTHLWTQGETHEARFWFPCFDYPNERSSTEVICHVPSDMTVLSNGKLVSEQFDSKTRLKAVHWLQAKPHVSYLICLVAGHLKKLEKKHGDIPLAFYTQPTLLKHAANSFRDTKRIMAFFEEEIGVAFPWDKYYQVTIRDFLAGGMENTSLTTLTHRTIFSEETENIRTTRRLDAHEMAHQWFGDLVTCKDWSHIWLNEGFAVYYTHLYEGHKFGRDALVYGLYRDATGRIFTQDKDKKPIVYKSYRNSREQFDYRAYPKGSWVLHMLRSQLGEDLFRRCIKTYLERHALSSVVSEDLRQVVEELSGRPFDQFFDQWVYHARFPDLKIKYRWLPGRKLAKVEIEQTQKVDKDVLLFRFPTKLRFVVDESVIDHSIEIRDKRHEVYVPLPAKPQIVRFDPDYSVLAKVSFDKPDGMLFAQLTKQDDVIGRILAAEALSKRTTQGSVDQLKAALKNDPFFGVRIAASSALQRIHNDEAFGALVESREQPDARVRQQVVEDIGKFYRQKAFDELEKILQTEKNPAIVAVAIRGLGRYHGPHSRELIVNYLRSESFRNELADAAIGAIRMQQDDTYVGPLVETLENNGTQFTSRGFGEALEALAHISHEADDKTKIRNFLAGHVNHPKQAVQLAAIRALGQLGDLAATPVLETLSDAGDDRVSDAARKALEELQKTAPLVPAELVKLRGEVTKLTESNKKLQTAVEDLKKQLDSIKPVESGGPAKE